MEVLVNNMSINVNFNQNQTSFGSISKTAKSVINRADVRTILEREHSIIGSDIRKLDESGLKFSLLSEVVPHLSETSGLCVTPPKGSNLPRVTVSMADIDLNSTNAQFFANMVKRAKEIETVYRNALKEFGAHSIRKNFTKKMSKIDSGFRQGTRDYVRAYNSSDRSMMSELEHSFKNNTKRRDKLGQTCQKNCADNQNSLIARVIPAWEEISQQRLV